MTCDKSTDHFILSLRQIASWQIPSIPNDNSAITGGVPALQRGAIWEPQQIEFLWDSIMRGFPIGSIVVIPKIENQTDKTSEVLSTTLRVVYKEKIKTHHILDGQQRCNAIAWGFVDPLNKDSNDGNVLWLDLNPDKKSLEQTTRKYLFRLTTKAHPWGFHHGDEAKYLEIAKKRKFQECLQKAKCKSADLNSDYNKLKEKLNQQDVDKRPLPSLALPYDAVFPVPVFLLFKHFDTKNNKVNWDHLQKEELVVLAEIWTGTKIFDLNVEKRANIELGLKMAEQSRLIALQAPDVFKDSIEDVEQIFQRLNGQGTPLDAEELTYSMIKAYWPDIEKVISEVPNIPITEVRLVNLGLRIALMDVNSEKLSPPLPVKRIREIFNFNGSINKKDAEDKKTIKEFFKSGECSELRKSLKWIDDSFLYNKDNCKFGLPAYLRSSIAWSSPEVFAWLMLLAKRNNHNLIDEKQKKKIIGLALGIHWFCEKKDKKEKSVNILIKLHDDLQNVQISDLKDDEEIFTLAPLRISELNDAFQIDDNSNHDQLLKWSFGDGIVKYDKSGKEYSDEDKLNRAKKYGYFIEKLRSQKELLIYDKREYIDHNFKDFDPSNKLMWKGHNRPWDYDHILPSNNLDGRRFGSKTYLGVCQAWQNSIGNLDPVDLYINREWQDAPASKKYSNDENIKGGAFDIKTEDTGDIIKARNFVFAAKNRLIRIYDNWYSNLIKLNEHS